jgi:hypothetical protein
MNLSNFNYALELAGLDTGKVISSGTTGSVLLSANNTGIFSLPSSVQDNPSLWHLMSSSKTGISHDVILSTNQVELGFTHNNKFFARIKRTDDQYSSVVFDIPCANKNLLACAIEWNNGANPLSVQLHRFDPMTNALQSEVKYFDSGAIVRSLIGGDFPVAFGASLIGDGSMPDFSDNTNLDWMVSLSGPLGASVLPFLFSGA